MRDIPDDQPAQQRPGFLSPEYTPAHLKQELLGGELRWLFTFFAVVAVGALAYFLARPAEAVVYFPLYIRGTAAISVLTVAAIVLTAIALVNWRNWRRRPNGR